MTQDPIPAPELTPALFAAQCLAAERDAEALDLRAKRAGAELLRAVLAARDATLPAAVREAKRKVMEQETPCE